MSPKRFIFHVPPEGFELMCRVCTKTCRNLLNIFEGYAGFDIISDAIMECAPVHISSTDNLPHRICNECITKLLSAHQFRKLCLQSDVAFRQYQNEIKSSPSSKQILDDIFEQSSDKITYNNVDVKIECNVENESRSSDNNDNQIINDYSDSDIDDAEWQNESSLSDKLKLSRKSLRFSLRKKISKEQSTKSDSDEEDDMPLKLRIMRKRKSVSTNKINLKCVNERNSCEKENKRKKPRGPYKQKLENLNDDGSLKLPSCDSCKMTFANRTSLARHLKTHGGQKPYSCEICHKRFATRQYVKGHMIIHTKERKYSCDVCGKTFMFNNDLKVHMRKHTGERPYVCEVCAKGFVSSSALNAHKFKHGPKRFFCIACNKGFTYKQECDAHVLIHRNDKFIVEDGDPDGILSTVAQSLEERSTQNVRNDVHNTSTKGDEHNQQITSEDAEQNNYEPNQNGTIEENTLNGSNHTNFVDVKSEINSNEVQHFLSESIVSKNRPPIKISKANYDLFLSEFERVKSTARSEDVTCDVCNKVLSSVSNLYRHKMIHKGIKRHTCEICNKSFKWRADLQDHKNRHLGIRKIQCEYCSKMFATKSDYGKHVSTHMDHKPFVCDICSRSYYNIYALNHHKKVHMHPYKCEHTGCCSSYPSEEKLARHMKTHDETKRKFRCDYCEKEITTMKGLMRHIRKMHKNEPQPLRGNDIYDNDKNNIGH